MLESSANKHMEPRYSKYDDQECGCNFSTDTITLGYWAFLDFALACIPIDMIWKLQLDLKKKFLLICLLGMGVL